MGQKHHPDAGSALETRNPQRQNEALVDSARQRDMLLNVEQMQGSTWLKRVLPVAFALAVSLVVHGALPLWGHSLFEPQPVRVSLSLLPAPPVPLPVLEDEPDAADEVLPAEPELSEPALPEAKKKRKPRAEPAPAETALAEKSRPVNQEIPEPEPSASARSETKTTKGVKIPPSSSRGSRFDIKRMREESKRRAALRNHLAAAKRKAARERADARSAGKKAGKKGARTASLGGKNRGNPDDVYACGPTDVVRRYRVREQRPLTDWVTVVPTALMPFRSRPALGDYLKDVAQVSLRRRRGEKRAGPVEFALPAGVLQLEIDKPAGARIALGLLAGRCVVGLRYSPKLFPLTLSRVPARIVGPGLPGTASVVSVTLRKDGSFTLVHEEGDALPFRSGHLKNHREIAGNIENHFAAARVIKEMAGWVGVDLAKMAQEDRRKKRAEARKKRRKRDKAKRDKRRDLARRSKK